MDYLRKLYKLIVLLLLGTVLTGCPPPCDYMLIDYGALSQEAIACSPYIDGHSYSFTHSGGHSISFLARRTREIQYEFTDECTEIRSESDLSVLFPDYPIFSCNVGMRKTDSTRYHCLIWVGESSFWLPFTIQTDIGHTYFDSLQIGQKWYQEVYKIGNNWREELAEQQILADSIYYNTSFGILKILMSNGEYYEIQN
jgi:hypothetical protein